MSENGNTKTILVVDDDRDYCEVTKMRLEAVGYQTAFAHDGQEALTMLEGPLAPDLIIMDTCMPVKDGLTALINLNARQKAKPHDKKRKIPVIIATGLESERIREIVTQLDANDFLRKPYEAEVLIAKIKNIIG
jgi:CheY-like chemotaxis protein